MIKAKIIKINGIVQGVGFRPFIYRLAKKYSLRGEVGNTEAGVYIHIEGEEKNIDFFSEEITKEKPPISLITRLLSLPADVKNFKTFSIIKTIESDKYGRSVLIPADVSICSDCLTELFDPNDRRYKYPFINCTNCGPRYTIIEDMPYDRSATTMKHFRMCNKCLAEYENPGLRRFHAQPNACPVCGPKVLLYDNRKNIIEKKDPISICSDLIKEGYIVAVKGIGGFHLACDARNDEAVLNLRRKKCRRDKPFALMSHDLKNIETYALIDYDEKILLESAERPILLLKKRRQNFISEYISPRNNYFGVMLPYTPLHYLILRQDFTALVMTSANISSEPIIKDNKKAFEALSGIADFFLIHNRKINISCDDSILKKDGDNLQIIRRSRGFAPTPIFLNKKVKQILACGGELKNTVCLTRDDKAFVSQYIGDIKSFDSYMLFRKTILHIKKIIDIEPEIVAFDMHPDYLSSRYAETIKNVHHVPVQHHHAHVVSCMAENSIYEPVIGIALDGTGYGTDDNIWGGEILIAEPGTFIRKAHISYSAMPGGEAAVKEPWRMAVSYLYETFGDDFSNYDIDFLKSIAKKDTRIIIEMISKKINSPFTSSIGRLFDGVASIIGIKNKITFEAQAAAELEHIANPNVKEYYEYEWIKNDIYEILFTPIIKGIVEDLEQKVAVSDISSKFHATIIEIFFKLCEEIRKDTNINKVALSGGVFQNSIISEGIFSRLKRAKFEVVMHRRLPSNDGGISLGQAVIADAKMRAD